MISIATFNFNIPKLTGMLAALLVSIVCARKVIEYRNKNRNNVIKTYMKDAGII